jgi:3-hydroxyisobutyrate dehydrogenase-like beta-hydroxyacid dehydrogenase
MRSLAAVGRPGNAWALPGSGRGALMAANLAREGFALTVWNRTPGRDQALLDLGATRAASPAELARSCDS